jgi:hypothetical protein
VQLSYWEQIVADGYRMPQGEALDDLTLELVTMLGDPDPRIRDDIAHSVIQAWVNEGVYDELLSGMGDGLVLGLKQGLGETGQGRDHVGIFRRANSAAALATVVTRDNTVRILHPATVLTWADRAVAWFLAERDLRGWLYDGGWAHAVAKGADLLGALAASRYLGKDELTVLLDVIAERLTIPTDYRFTDGEGDRLALTTMSLLHRDLIAAEAVESWLGKLSPAWQRPYDSSSPREPWCANTISYLRSLHVQLLLGVRGTPTQFASSKAIVAPSVRSDVLIAVQTGLRQTEPWYAR